MRQFFMVLGAVFVIIAGVSPIKRLPTSEIGFAERIPFSEIRSAEVLAEAAARQLRSAVRVGVVPASSLP